MPFDPAKPANHSPNSSAEMREQLTSLKALIDARATPAEVTNAANAAQANAINASSNNSNGVATLGQTADASYQQWQMQLLFDKLDELINALRRV